MDVLNSICLIIGLLLLVSYLICKLTCGIATNATCLNGKTVLIVGASSGIGYEIAKTLASRGARLIIADVVNVEKTTKSLIKFTHNQNIVGKFVDLTSFKTVRALAEDISRNEESLDILIHNAGVSNSSANLTEDGLNAMRQINYFGPFLLTHLLIGLLKKSKPSRVVFTSSGVAFMNNFKLKELTETTHKNTNIFEVILAYNNSKFCVALMANLFAKKISPTEVTFNSINPGIICTDIFAKGADEGGNKLKMRLTVQGLLTWTAIFGKSAWEGAQTTLHVALDEKLENISGEHFWDCRPFFKPWGFYNKEVRGKIWEITEKCVKLKPEEKIV